MSTQHTTNETIRLHVPWRDRVRGFFFDHPYLSNLAITGPVVLAYLTLPIAVTIVLVALLIVAFVASLFLAFRSIDRRMIKTERALYALEQQIDCMKRRGIYLIYCSKEGASYLGSTEVNFHIRWGQHITQLNRDEHPNARLQDAWNRYGPEDFAFFVMESIDDVADIRPREIEHLEWRAMNMPARQNYNVNNSRVRTAAPLPELQFIYPTKIVPAPAPRLRSKRKPGGSK